MSESDGKTVEFWFDFSSPYAYFAALQIEGLAARHGRTVAWRPFLLHVAFQRTGMVPLTRQSIRGDYARHDWQRLGREHRVPFKLPSNFPLLTTAPARMVYATVGQDPALGAIFSLALFRELFEHDRDISQANVAASIGAELGLEESVLLAAANEPRWKEVLRQRTEEALAKGVFGSPFLFVDGEGFWGADRLPMVDRWLASGGW